jgi:carboxypeptidase family protein
MPEMRVAAVKAALKGCATYVAQGFSPAVMLTVVFVASALAQQTRDHARPTQGRARITGTVTAADTGTPVRRAAVRLLSSGRQLDTAVTDPNGRFEFVELPAGTYTVAASKAGFVTASFGQKSYGGEPQSIELTGSQRFDAAHIRLLRGGVMTGRVFDEFGDPIPEASIHAARTRYVQGMRRLDVVTTATSNDIGQFRLYGLTPGTYYLSGTFRAPQNMPMRDRGVMFQGPAGLSTFVETYYPGGLTVERARPLQVEAGQEIANLEFTLQPVRLVRLSGRVVDSRGRPVSGARVALLSTGRDAIVVGNMISMREKRTTEDGAFQLTGIAPGEYRLDVRPSKDVNAVEDEYASLPVSVPDDVEGLIVTTSRGRTISGRVIVEGATFDAEAMVRMSINAFDVLGGGGTDASTPPAPSIAPDGSFQIRGLIGTPVVRLTRLPQGWMLKAVRVQGDDVTDRGVEMRGVDVSDVEVIVARETQAHGIVVDARGQPAPDRGVIVFSEDRTRWSGFLNRHVRSARAGLDGTFAIAGLPAGDYLVAAVEPPEDDWMTLENLDRLRATATRFTLADGAQKALRLVLR